MEVLVLFNVSRKGRQLHKTDRRDKFISGRRSIAGIRTFFVSHLDRWRVSCIVMQQWARRRMIILVKDFPSQLMHFRFLSQPAEKHNTHKNKTKKMS